MNNLGNSSVNPPSKPNKTEHAPMNLFLISTSECTKSNSIYYCNYAASLILLGYLLHSAIFPLTLYRMKQLKSKFRNQYNLSLIWLCSLLLISTIDIVEYILARDANVFSQFIVLVQCFYFFGCLMTIILYVKHCEINGAQRLSILKIALTALLFLIIVFTRILTAHLQASSSTSKSIFNYQGKYSHFYLYYLVYLVLAFSQIYYNFQNKFARCFTNLTYGVWVIGAFFLSFYSLILKEEKQYDWLHYRNYFLMSTLIVIVLQDINFLRVKLAERSRHAMKNVSMHLFTLDSHTTAMKHDKMLSMSESSGELAADHDDDEDIFFDRNQFDNNSNNNKNANSFNSKNVVQENLYNRPEPRAYEGIQIRMPPQRKSFVVEFINNNQTFFICCFVGLLLLTLLCSTILLFKSVSLSSVLFFTPLVYPIIIAAFYISKRF